MAKLVFSLNLVQKPKLVRVLRHAMAGVVVVAVAYEAFSVPGQRQRGYFTIVELPLCGLDVAEPNPRVLHLPLPPAKNPNNNQNNVQEVTSLALVRSIEGDTVYVALQCCDALSVEKNPQPASPTASISGDCYLYRRMTSHEVENEEERGVGGPVAVRYHRLPYAIDVGGREWTAAEGVAMVENAIATAATPLPLLIAASRSQRPNDSSNPSNDDDDETKRKREAGGRWFQGTALQWVGVGGPARAKCQRTLQLPALAGFDVGAVVPLPGSGGSRILLLCHHAIVEIDGKAIENDATESHPSNPLKEAEGVLRRCWRWSPHSRLTACCARDAFLFAATEEGEVVVWDLRRPGPRITADEAWHSTLSEAISSHHSNNPNNEGKVAVKGIYAPHSMAFLTCALDGSVVYWTRRSEGEAWQGALAHPQDIKEGSPTGYKPNDPPCVRRRFASTPNASGCVAMAGDGNLAVVVRELGELEVYWCP